MCTLPITCTLNSVQLQGVGRMVWQTFPDEDAVFPWSWSLNWRVTRPSLHFFGHTHTHIGEYQDIFLNLSNCMPVWFWCFSKRSISRQTMCTPPRTTVFSLAGLAAELDRWCHGWGAPYMCIVWVSMCVYKVMFFYLPFVSVYSHAFLIHMYIYIYIYIYI